MVYVPMDSKVYTAVFLGQFPVDASPFPQHGFQRTPLTICYFRYMGTTKFVWINSNYTIEYISEKLGILLLKGISSTRTRRYFFLFCGD